MLNAIKLSAVQVDDAQYEVIEPATQMQPLATATDDTRAEVTSEPYRTNKGSRVGMATSGWGCLILVLLLMLLFLLSVTALVVSVVTAVRMESNKEFITGETACT
jgi:hypothetical protein